MNRNGVPYYRDEEIARVGHDAIRALRSLENGHGGSMPPWDETAEEVKGWYTMAVRLACSGSSAAAMHAAWCDRSANTGWRWGPEIDFEKKTHPSLVPWDRLTPEERTQTHMFIMVVLSLVAPL